MPTYTFCGLTRGGAVMGVQAHELPSDAAATARAFALLEERPNADQAEVWQGERLVCRALRRAGQDV